MANTFGDTHLDMLKVHPFTSVPVVYGAVNGYGFDFVRGTNVRVFAGDAEGMVEETSVCVKYGDFSALQQDGSITVDSTTYQIRRVEDIDDGHVIRLVLADA
jgi:hypothetical protein